MQHIVRELDALKNSEKGIFLQRFFKSGKEQYAEGDIFLGITVPQQRAIAKKYFKEISLKDLGKLLESTIHEHRLTALIMLTLKYAKADEEDKKKLYEFYVAHREYVNNWDLVDSSAGVIMGDYLFDKPKQFLTFLAKSPNMWDRRIAIIATYGFIKRGRFDETLKIAELLVHDKHDLIQKAVGWMLREVGNRDLEVEERFLQKHYKTMPRTMLRYAIERFDEKKRKLYMGK